MNTINLLQTKLNKNVLQRNCLQGLVVGIYSSLLNFSLYTILSLIIVYLSKHLDLKVKLLLLLMFTTTLTTAVSVPVST